MDIRNTFIQLLCAIVYQKQIIKKQLLWVLQQRIGKTKMELATEVVIAVLGNNIGLIIQANLGQVTAQ